MYFMSCEESNETFVAVVIFYIFGDSCIDTPGNFKFIKVPIPIEIGYNYLIDTRSYTW